MAMGIDELLLLALERRASDIHLKAGRPPLFRIAARVVPAEQDPLSAEQVQTLVYSMMVAQQIQMFETTNELDFSYGIPGKARFRVNVFRSRGQVGAVLRTIPLRIPTLEELGMPAVLKDMVSKPQGLVLVTGPTGSGKSTTLAALIDFLNTTTQGHIVTIEDPIEYVHPDKQCSVTQREVGLDTRSFAEALRRALRQDPDVILIGEMRDLETISTAITAAETGHLVLSTLHTNDATQTVDRIIDSFPPHQQQQIRLQLSVVLQGVVSQRLCRRADGNGRIAAVEVMVASPTIRKLIEEARTGELGRTIESSGNFYRMQTLNQSLVALCQRGWVTVEEAMAVSPNPDQFKLNLRGIYSGSSADQVAR